MIQSRELRELIGQTRSQSGRMKTVFFDIDSQLDFLYPAGALYVPGAERIVPAIARLNRFAAMHGIPVVSTIDAHTENDPEFADLAAALRRRHHGASARPKPRCWTNAWWFPTATANWRSRARSRSSSKSSTWTSSPRPTCTRVIERLAADALRGLRRGHRNLRAPRGPRAAEVRQAPDHRDRRHRRRSPAKPPNARSRRSAPPAAGWLSLQKSPGHEVHRRRRARAAGSSPHRRGPDARSGTGRSADSRRGRGRQSSRPVATRRQVSAPAGSVAHPRTGSRGHNRRRGPDCRVARGRPRLRARPRWRLRRVLPRARCAMPASAEGPLHAGGRRHPGDLLHRLGQRLPTRTPQRPASAS